MKKYFKINEISKLFNIGVDSLRYYEKIGLISPRRDTNNYRMYSLSEIYQLNIISDLKKLHFTLPQIKRYLEDQSLSNTISILYEKENYIESEIKRLKEESHLIKSQISSLKSYSNKKIEAFEIFEFPKRNIIKLKTDIVLDEEFDFSIRVLQKEHNFNIHQFENEMVGASISLKKYFEEEKITFQSVFIFKNEKIKTEVDSLPSGKYLCYSYRKNYTNLPGHINKILEYCKLNKIEISNTIYELYLIDNRHTANSNEYLTEIQIQILN